MINQIHFVTNVPDGFPNKVENYTISFSHSISKYEGLPLDKSGEIIYLIDVHFCFGKNQKLEKQQGVDFYRLLLNKFSDCQQNLKVIFYSPLTINSLANEKPENYILNKLPFIQTKGERGFEKQLIETINSFSNKWPVFNNSSESLLAGWSLYNTEKESESFVKTINKNQAEYEFCKIALIDDQLNEWINVFRIIFEKESIFIELPYIKNPKEPGAFNINKIVNLAENIKKANIVISDFYLEEKHLTNKWLTNEELRNKSGYKLFNYIKGNSEKEGINGAIPYVIHSSSNKIQYFKSLSNDGIDNWLVKDTRINISNTERKENYITFKNEIENYTIGNSSKVYKKLSKFWGVIESFPDDKIINPIHWWDTKTRKPIIIGLLKQCWFAIRNELVKNPEIINYNLDNSSLFIVMAVINNLGSIIEITETDLKVQKQERNLLYRFISQFRNEGSHYSSGKTLNLEDCLIYFEIWLQLLKSSEKEKKIVFRKPNHVKNEYMFQEMEIKKNKESSFKNRVLLTYLQFYNSNYSNFLSSEILNKIKSRCEKLLENSEKAVLIKEMFTHEIPHYLPRDFQLSKLLGFNNEECLINDPNKIFRLEFDDFDKLSIINE